MKKIIATIALVAFASSASAFFGAHNRIRSPRLTTFGRLETR